MIMIAGMVCGLVAFGFILWGVYGGGRQSLGNAKVGEVYNFIYEQPVSGDPERYLAKVVGLQKLSEESIRRLNWNSNYRRNDPMFVRTHHLVTCQTPDGRIRNFYAERTRNCRKPPLARFMFGTPFAQALV